LRNCGEAPASKSAWALGAMTQQLAAARLEATREIGDEAEWRRA